MKKDGVLCRWRRKCHQQLCNIHCALSLTRNHAHEFAFTPCVILWSRKGALQRHVSWFCFPCVKQVCTVFDLASNAAYKSSHRGSLEQQVPGTAVPKSWVDNMCSTVMRRTHCGAFIATPTVLHCWQHVYVNSTNGTHCWVSMTKVVTRTHHIVTVFVQCPICQSWINTVEWSNIVILLKWFNERGTGITCNVYGLHAGSTHHSKGENLERKKAWRT